MREPIQTSRLWIMAAVLFGAIVLLNTVSHGEPVIPRNPLRSLPYQVDAWRGEDHPLAAEEVDVARPTDYTNRVYRDNLGTVIQLYIGYYASQKTGDTIHSPKNCLPGAGWEPVRSDYKSISLWDGKPFDVNEYVIQQNRDEQLVFYWYQGRGRIVASEYAGKFWMMVDAISRNRTDGALVRVNTPINAAESDAETRLLAFTRAIFPEIDSLIPK